MSITTGTIRDRILDAAFRLFSSRGIAGTSTREIARAASCNEVTLFRHFRRKDALVRAAIERALPALVMPRLQELALTGDLEDDLYRFTCVVMRLHDEQEEFFRFVLGTIVQFPEHREFFDRMHRPMREFLVDFLRPLAERAGLDPTVVALEFDGPIVTRSIRRIFLGDLLVTDEIFARTHARMLCRALTPSGIAKES